MAKRWKMLINSFVFFLAFIAGSIASFAQSGDDPNSIYDNRNYAHVPSPYSGVVPYLVFGAVILFLAFIGYRYWHDHAQE